MSDTAPEATAFDLADQIEHLADSITVERRPPSRPLPPGHRPRLF